jgi:organic radical activating enzyme
MKKHYCLIITYECNWNCPYCIIDTHKRIINKEQVLKNINTIEDNSIITISGGEPGTQTLEFLEYLFSILFKKNCTLELTTNGLFLKKYPHLYNKFESILYHCSENLNNNIIKFQDPDNKIQYQLIITNENYIRLEEFINKNIDITFQLQADVKLNKLIGIKIWNKYKNIITPKSKYYLMNNVNKVDKKLLKIF